MPEEYSIFIKNLSGKTIPLLVKNTMTISQLKSQILPGSSQFSEAYLLFGYNQLNDEMKKLEDYGIKDQSTIHMLARLRGGIF